MFEYIQRIFPEALPVADATVKYLRKVQTEFGVSLSDVIYAESTCVDEINRLGDSALGSINGPFVLGGLAGLPFVGVTGLAAFASHIPDRGIPLIVYGPHIGVAGEGRWGKTCRLGQESDSDGCGALLAAMRRFQSDPDYRPETSTDDYQQSRLEQLLAPHRDRFVGVDNPEIGVTKVAFELIDEQLRAMLAQTANRFPCQRAILLGVVQINTDVGWPDYFAVQTFELLNLSG